METKKEMEGKSKLSLVHKALEENPNIVIVDVRESNYLSERFGYRNHTVDFVVASKTGVYTADKLQELMMSLIPDVKPSSKDDFYYTETTMAFGKLYFDEIIGENKKHVREEIALTDEDLFSTPGFTDGKMVIEENQIITLQRRIWVRVYPNIEIATSAANWVPLKELKKYYQSEVQKHRGLFARLIQRRQI